MSIARYAVNLSILFTELPLLSARRPPWRRASVAPSSGGRSRPRCLATVTSRRSCGRSKDAGVSLTGLNFFAGDMPAGDRGLVS